MFPGSEGGARLISRGISRHCAESLRRLCVSLPWTVGWNTVGPRSMEQKSAKNNRSDEGPLTGTSPVWTLRNYKSAQTQHSWYTSSDSAFLSLHWCHRAEFDENLKFNSESKYNTIWKPASTWNAHWCRGTQFYVRVASSPCLPKSPFPCAGVLFLFSPILLHAELIFLVNYSSQCE